MDSTTPKHSEDIGTEPKKENDKEENKNEETKNLSPLLILENVERLDEFDENNYKVRKYNSKNYENGQKFYKLRYIQRKIKERKNKKSSILQKDKEICIELDDYEKELLLKYENLALNHKKTKQKFIQKYSYLFLILIEKSIIYFNLKLFKESYNILYYYGIIQNPYEFGEILLTISGYDRTLIAQFITKNINPNENWEVLKGIINCFEMSNFDSLIECYKNMCSKINFSHDTELTTILVREISIIYSEINKNTEEFMRIFKNDINVGILLKAVSLALRSFNEKEDNKVNKETFSMMVDFIEKQKKYEIFNNLKKKKINISLDNDYYNELYTKFNIFLVEQKNVFDNIDKKIIYQEEYSDYYEYLERKELKEEEIDKKYLDNINSFKNFINFSKYNSFTQVDQQCLTTPTQFYKISGASATNLKEYIVIDNFEKIAFEKTINELSKFKHFILTNDIIDIFLGTNHGENIKKYLKAFPKEEENQNSFISIVCNKEQLDLKSTKTTDGIKWYKALKTLIMSSKQENKNTQKNKNESEQNKIKEEIEYIWNHILGKWEIYGNYLLFKCLDHSNYLPDMNFEGKPQPKIEFFEDKKTPLLRLVHNFLKETKDKVSKKDGKLEYHEFVGLCQLGIPEFSREKIWPILIGNKSGITNSIYNSLKEKIAQINNFEDLELKYKKNASIIFIDNFIINKMIKDIIKIKYLFYEEYSQKTTNKEEINLVMSKVYSICRCFYLYRYDIPYNKNIISIIYILLLNNISEEDAFICINNIICSDSIISKIYLWKEKSLKNLEIFFEEKFREYLPRLSMYFKKLGITCNFYLFDWLEGLFTQTLDNKIASFIFELYLIFGEYILIQTSIVILKLLEEDLLNLTIDEIFMNLKRMPLKLSLISFFDVFRNYLSLKEAFKENRVNKEFGDQKTDLLEILINN